MRRVEILEGLDKGGFFHHMVAAGDENEIFAVIELDDGSLTVEYIENIRFLDTPKELQELVSKEPQELARYLKKYCKEHPDCTDCVFKCDGERSYCRLYDVPIEWKI